MQKLLANIYFKAFFVLFLMVMFSLFGYGIAFGYGGGGGGGGGGAPTVQNITAVNLPLSIDAAQGGNLIKNLPSGSKAEVSVPKGAVSGETNFDVAEGSLGADNTPVATTGAFLVGGKVFNIEAKDIDNNAVRNFSQSISVTLTIPGLPTDTSDLGVYYFNDTSRQWVLVLGATFDPATGKVTFSVNHLTKFAVFKVSNMPVVMSSGTAEEVEEDETAQEAEAVSEEEGTEEAQTEYAEGTLLRGSDKKIYVVKNGMLEHIRSLAQLRLYAGQKIYDVADGVISGFGQAVKQIATAQKTAYANGELIRGANKKVYVIENGKAKHIRSLVQLAKYAGQEIYDVADSVINMYLEEEAPAVQEEQSEGTGLKPASMEFTRDFKIWSYGDDVKALQEFLNNNGYLLDDSGMGSPGKETKWFVIKTKAALKKFQNDHREEILVPAGLEEGNGVFGPITRAFINSLR